MDWIPHGEACLYLGMLILCKSYYGDYACSCDGVSMSDGDGIASSTQVLVVRRLWPPVATSCHAKH
jgi:hypothetical protein